MRVSAKKINETTLVDKKYDNAVILSGCEYMPALSGPRVSLKCSSVKFKAGWYCTVSDDSGSNYPCYLGPTIPTSKLWRRMKKILRNK